MTVAWTAIRDMPSGEFAAMSESVIQDYIDEAVGELSESAYGDRYDQAVKYLAAHLLAMAKKGSTGATGPVTMEQVGPVSRQFASMNMSAADSSLLATTYGRRFQEIRAQCCGGPRVV